MTKFCTECGFENRANANFCVNCGNPFDVDMDHNNLNSNNSSSNQLIDNSLQLNENNNNQLSNYQSSLQLPQKYKGYDITEESQCFNCHQHKFVHLNKKSLLSDKWAYFCTNCGLTLEKHKEEFKLTDIADKTSRIWDLYKLKTLTKPEWERIANGGLSDKDQEERDKQLALQKQQELELQRKKDLQFVVNKLSSGEANLKTVNSPVILKKNEEAYLSLPNIKLSEPRAVRVSQSGGVGTSYRVGKGLTVHSGTGQSKSVSHDKIMAIDTGTFVITNKRLVFVGSKKSVNIDLKKILSINIFKDGISIQRENKQKVEYFTGTNKSSMDFTLEGRKQTLDLEGYLVRAIILGQISKLK